MTDDLVQRLRSNRPIPTLPHEAADRMEEMDRHLTMSGKVNKALSERIEVLEAENKWLKVQLSVESEPSPYCPICGSCGDEGCCGPKRCLYPAAEWQAGYEAGVEAAAKALEADAKLCDCAALEERECGCGAWDDYKSITSARAVEIVRALVTEPAQHS